MMEKLMLISCSLFFLADVFAIISLILPDWIVSPVGGETKLGLTQNCMTTHGRSQVCFPSQLHPEWLLTLLCVICGCLLVKATISLQIMSNYYAHLITHARWAGFTAIVLFCTAAVIFPMGFTMDEIGGEPYQLPSSHEVGISYIFFVLALWITVISELFAGKVCMPHF